MEEDIKNMSKEELLEYLEEISQQLDNIALDQIKIAIAELQYFKDQYKHYKQFDSIPKSKVKEKIEEINKAYEDSKDENGESQYYYPDYTIRVLEELLEKRK